MLEWWWEIYIQLIGFHDNGWLTKSNAKKEKKKKRNKIKYADNNKENTISFNTGMVGVCRTCRPNISLSQHIHIKTASDQNKIEQERTTNGLYFLLFDQHYMAFVCLFVYSFVSLSCREHPYTHHHSTEFRVCPRCWLLLTEVFSFSNDRHCFALCLFLFLFCSLWQLRGKDSENCIKRTCVLLLFFLMLGTGVVGTTIISIVWKRRKETTCNRSSYGLQWLLNLNIYKLVEGRRNMHTIYPCFIFFFTFLFLFWLDSVFLLFLHIV